MPPQFAFIIGKCTWAPPGPKAALLLVMWMFGTDPNNTYSDYESEMVRTLVEYSYTQVNAEQEVAHLNECFASYRITMHRNDPPITPNNCCNSTHIDLYDGDE